MPTSLEPARQWLREIAKIRLPEWPHERAQAALWADELLAATEPPAVKLEEAGLIPEGEDFWEWVIAIGKARAYLSDGDSMVMSSLAEELERLRKPVPPEELRALLDRIEQYLGDAPELWVQNIRKVVNYVRQQQAAPMEPGDLAEAVEYLEHGNLLDYRDEQGREWPDWAIRTVLQGLRQHQADKPLAERVRVSQTPQTGIGAIIGKWPGTETDEEVQAALHDQDPGQAEEPEPDPALVDVLRRELRALWHTLGHVRLADFDSAIRRVLAEREGADGDDR